ncbi:glycoside hydrolase family 16 protein [Pseudonocardia oroxyli]|uniref:glycoside hydrolase family 16 protein n=1 Tax=Pseudonocardia oroxyli TaxID=366584 RepID=UPI001C409492|nr:glycoside hydrolase family 16 protein [Pseudonocardia oroxyli]
MPGVEGQTAAALLGWGAPVAGDEFDYVGPPDPARWGLYEGAGHDNNGRRVASAWSVDGDVVTVRGNTAGDSGGMAYRTGQYRGKWEARMRAPVGDPDYHPVLLLWPDAEDWPVGGEVDYAEISDPDRQNVDFFLHYGASNSQTQTSRALDVTQWHNYAVEWTDRCIIGYIDGAQWFADCEPGHQPPRAMHMTIQLDAFNGDGPYRPSEMMVDWIRQYR